MEQRERIKINSSFFRIVQFADLHMGESDAQDQYSLQVMRDVVSLEQPNLIVFSGDQVAGYAAIDDEQRSLLWQKALSVSAEAGIPFTTIFGNHDDQPYRMDPMLLNEWMLISIVLTLTLLLLSLRFQSIERFGWVPIALTLISLLFFFGISVPNHSTRDNLLKHERLKFPVLSYTGYNALNLHGVSNYRLVLQSPNTSMALYFLDTGGGWIPMWVHGVQLKWLMGFAPMPSLAFMHIPPEGFGSVFSTPSDCFGPSPLEKSSSCPGSHGLLQTLSSIGTIGVFVGHDHGNTGCCRSKSMLLCYGKHSGFGGYDFNESERGARVIDIQMHNHADIRIETRISFWRRTLKPSTA